MRIFSVVLCSQDLQSQNQYVCIQYHQKSREHSKLTFDGSQKVCLDRGSVVERSPAPAPRTGHSPALCRQLPVGRDAASDGLRWATR
jgi:hypothetical protein